MEGLEYIKSVLAKAGYKVLEDAVEEEQKFEPRAEKAERRKKREKTEEKHAILGVEAVTGTPKPVPAPAAPASVEEKKKAKFPDLYEQMLQAAIEYGQQMAERERKDAPAREPSAPRKRAARKPAKKRITQVNLSEEQKKEVAEVSNVNPNLRGGSYTMRLTFTPFEFLALCRRVKELGMATEREYAATVISKDLNMPMRGAIYDNR